MKKFKKIRIFLNGVYFDFDSEHDLVAFAKSFLSSDFNSELRFYGHADVYFDDEDLKIFLFHNILEFYQFLKGLL